ncbi:P-loop containing nucleoside triphosphate hydrolase protein [Crepidotus variabilis]|uniref:DNA 3'-5' helicase n=1 Tax=Crepidotus variabilis TaxID=179855 RepID=A0A9P6EGT2_9AGAR|nr:P-loop containing nucleoside triphosphate hydrolase protein [Crepidotus variabilis]
MEVVSSGTRDEAFSWTSLLGRTLIREIVEERITQWPKGPHETQLDCWANLLAGKHVLLIASTGWGKTAAFFGPILVLQHLIRYPRLCGPSPPPTPVALVITPLIELGNAHATEISKFGLRTVSINAETIRAASDEGRNLMKEVRLCKWPIVLLSAERLVNKDFDTILRDPNFRHNLVVLGIDEAHLVVPWGKDFRKAYSRIAHLMRRLPSHTPVVSVTATLSEKDEQELCTQLGYNMKKNEVHCIRLSSERSNVRLIFRELRHSLGGYTFPDIAWAFCRGTKTVIYCNTLDLCFRVALYGWNQYPPDDRRRLEKVRLWTSITSSRYNQQTLDLFANDPDCSTIVATIAFGLGMNIRNITDSVNLGLPSSLSTLVQQNGRAGRDFSICARGWTYIESSILSSIRNNLESNKSSTSKMSKSKTRMDSIEADLYSSAEAHVTGHCLYVHVNQCMGNHGPTSSLPCSKADRELWCSNCQPFFDNPCPQQPPSAQTMPTPAPPETTTSSVVFKPYTKAVQENAALWLDDFAEARWADRSDLKSRYLPSDVFWTGTSVVTLCQSLHLLRSRQVLDNQVQGWANLLTDGDALWDLIKTLTSRFDDHMQKVNQARGQKAAETRTRNRLEGNSSLSHLTNSLF